MSRREVEQQSFSLPVAILVPLGAILLQVLLPRLLHGLAILDLPFIVTLFFAISRRSPIAGTVTGATIGLLQDVLTGQPIGVNGMAKSVIGYAGASLGSRIDVENNSTRALLTFGFSLLQSVLLYLIERRLLGLRGFHLLWLHELLRAVVNTVVALPIFLLLDRTRHQE
jgi:rod shape-determining protein MreD